MDMNNRETKQNESTIGTAPTSYMTQARDIRSVPVQELSLRRLKRHIDALPTLKNQVDFVSAFFGGCLSCVITIVIEVYKTQTIPIEQVILALVLLLIAFAIQCNKEDYSQVNQIIAEAKEDITEIYKQTNLSEDGRAILGRRARKDKW